MSTFEELVLQEEEAAARRPAIVAPLRVRRRERRPAVAEPHQHQQQQQQHHHQQQPRSPIRGSPHARRHHNDGQLTLVRAASLALVIGAAGIAAFGALMASPPPAFAGEMLPAAASAASRPLAASLPAAVASAFAGGGLRHAGRRAPLTPPAAASSSSSSYPPPPATPPVRLLAVVGAGDLARSPYEYSAPTAEALRQQGLGASPPPPPFWRDVAPHLAERLKLSDPRLALEVLDERALIEGLDGGAGGSKTADAVLEMALSRGGGSSGQPPVVAIVAMGLTDPRTADLLSSRESAAASVGTLLALPTDAEKHGGSTTTSVFSRVQQRAGGFDPARASSLERLLAERVPFSPQARASKLLRDSKELLSRRTSDDALFALLSVVHASRPGGGLLGGGAGAGVSIPEVANAAQGGLDLGLLVCVMRHCRDPVLSCVQDPTCKAALDCLDAVPPNDQVASYRCIVAHESPLFTRFSLCVLELHNCRGLTAEVPQAPDPPPKFGTQKLTHAIAEGILFGHGATPSVQAASPAAQQAALIKGTRGWAWRIAGGKNAAFDQFPSQHQLFYRSGKAPPGSPGGSIWYVPVFAVAPDNVVLRQKVWRDRRYRVRLGQEPGRFVFTVSDNGVTSYEEWTILDADDTSGGLEWALFYYRGAAKAAGMQYTGAVLATRDGDWPQGVESAERIEQALKSAGIEPWELTRVDNSAEAVAGAPLPPNGGWPVGVAAAA